MELKTNDTTAAYLSRFYEPEITAYEFLKYFFACLKELGEESVNRDLVSFLYHRKQQEDERVVLEEISFRSNGVNHYSDDVEDALFNLQNGGLLGKMNPSFGKIIIKYSDDDVADISKNISDKFKPIIMRIAEDFKNS